VLTELRTNGDQSQVGVTQNTLTVSRELRKLGLPWKIAPSSKGKTATLDNHRGFEYCAPSFCFLPLLTRLYTERM
jgi:hypothetical protein